MTQQRKPSPRPRRAQEQEPDQELSYEHAQKAYDDAYAAWERLVNDDEYKAVTAELDAAIERWNKFRAPIDETGRAVDEAYAVLKEITEARRKTLTPA